MLLKDGSFEIYKIQHLAYVNPEAYVYSSFDYFGYPKTGSDKDEFTPSGQCWQQTGEHGVYDLMSAKKGLKYIQEMWPKEKFRVVKVIISQQTIIV